MQDIHIPVKWIAFWRRLRRLEKGGGLWMTVEMGIFFNCPPLPNKKNRHELASLLLLTKSIWLAGTKAFTHGWDYERPSGQPFNRCSGP